MAYEYSAQNHDWDLTLHAASELISMGLLKDQLARTGSVSMGFSFFVGGMVLAFAAIESFSASVAFAMQSNDRDSGFSFQDYRKTRSFWDKMDMLMSAAGINIDKSAGLFRDILEMQQWRNLVTHSTPFEIEPKIIREAVKAPSKIYRKMAHLDYARTADAEHALKFYRTAAAFIELLSDRSGLEPHSSVTYKPLPPQSST